MKNKKLLLFCRILFITITLVSYKKAQTKNSCQNDAASIKKIEPLSLIMVNMGDLGSTCVKKIHETFAQDFHIFTKVTAATKNESPFSEQMELVTTLTPPFVLIDATDNTQTFPLYKKTLLRGGYVVTCNKNLISHERMLNYLNKIGKEHFFYQAALYTDNDTVIKKLLSALREISLKLRLHQDFLLRSDEFPAPKKIYLSSPVLARYAPQYKEASKTIPVCITLKTKSGINVPALFFDRNSNVALIVGQGFNAPKEDVLVYATLFENYDVILFDYRWTKHYYRSFLTSFLFCQPTKRMLLDEKEEIIATIDFIKQRKPYKKVVGLGECYSTFLFALLQAEAVKKNTQSPFSHLIFDSCWLSTKKLLQNMCNDPKISLETRNKNMRNSCKNILGSAQITQPMINIIFTFAQNASIEEYLADVKIPVLFIYGQNDVFVPHNDFETIWNATAIKNRVALLTPYRHADNLHNKTVYRFVCEHFIQATSITNFLKTCKSIL